MCFDSGSMQKRFIPIMHALGIKKHLLMMVFFISMLCYGEIIQFSAAEQECFILTNSTSVVEWNSLNTTNLIRVVHRNAYDWRLPTLTGDKISFLNASPLEFLPSELKTYTKIFVVAHANNLKPWSTLVDADIGLNVLPNAFAATGESGFKFYKSSNTAKVYINGEQTTHTLINQSFIVELLLDEPSNLNNVFIGGSPATTYWNRSWDGYIYEILFVEEELTEEQYSAIYTYLSIKHKIPVAIELNDNAYTVLKALNIRSGSAFTTMILMR